MTQAFTPYLLSLRHQREIQTFHAGGAKKEKPEGAKNEDFEIRSLVRAAES
jgi:hypothetical protein